MVGLYTGSYVNGCRSDVILNGEQLKPSKACLSDGKEIFFSQCDYAEGP